jgi:energy-coupling factor transport system permease protein
VARFNPKARILLYLLLVIAVFLSDRFSSGLFLLILTVVLAVRVPFSVLKRGLVPILFFLFFTFLSNVLFQKGNVYSEIFGFPITDEGLRRGGLLTLRLFTLILGAKILTATTPAGDLVRGMKALLGPLGRVGFVSELMLTMSLTLRLLPIVYDEALDLFRNVKNSGQNGIAGKIKLAVSLLTPLFERSLQKAKKMTDLEDEFEH